MKVNIQVDMTPDEARRMMGLPDVSSLQQRMMEQMEARMKAAMDTSDPEAMAKAWMGGMQGFEHFQRLLWDSALKTAGGENGKKPAAKSR
jgi:hypothetical protein